MPLSRWARQAGTRCLAVPLRLRDSQRASVRSATRRSQDRATDLQRARHPRASTKAACSGLAPTGTAATRTPERRADVSRGTRPEERGRIGIKPALIRDQAHSRERGLRDESRPGGEVASTDAVMQLHMAARSEGTPNGPNAFPSLMPPFHELGLTASSNLPDPRSIRVGIDLPWPEVDDLRPVGSFLDLHAGAVRELVGLEPGDLDCLLPIRVRHSVGDARRRSSVCS